MVETFKRKLSSLDIHTLEVIKKSSASIIVKVLGLAAGFGTSIILGRTIGPEGLGVINLSTKVVTLIMIFASLGMDNVVRKEVAIAFERKDWQHVANTIFTALRINIPIALSISLILIFFTPWLTENFFEDPRLEIPLIIYLAVMVPQVISKIFASGINGFRKIWQSNLVDATLSSVITLLGLGILLLLDIEITIINAAILYAIGRISVTFTVGLYWRRLFQFKGSKTLQSKPMLKVALPLLLVTSTSVIAASADTIMLGWLSSTKEVGLYSVALRLGLLSNIFLMISVSTLAPKIASLYAEKKKKELEKMIQQVTKGLFILGLAVLVGYVLLGKFILNFWGDEFVTSYAILIIITMGQFVNVSTGSTGVILMMTGFEKNLSRITLTALALNIILNLILIPHYGAAGAAIATTSTVILENILKVILVRTKTGISTIPFLMASTQR